MKNSTCCVLYAPLLIFNGRNCLCFVDLVFFVAAVVFLESLRFGDTASVCARHACVCVWVSFHLRERRWNLKWWTFIYTSKQYSCIWWNIYTGDYHVLFVNVIYWYNYEWLELIRMSKPGRLNECDETIDWPLSFIAQKFIFVFFFNSFPISDSSNFVSRWNARKTVESLVTPFASVSYSCNKVLNGWRFQRHCRLSVLVRLG